MVHLTVSVSFLNKEPCKDDERFFNPKRITINGGTEIDKKTGKLHFAKQFIYITVDSCTCTSIKVLP